MKYLTLQLQGLRCTGCADRVRSGLATQPGVKHTDVSFEQALARVLYDPQATDKQRIVQAVEGLGYRVAAPGEASGEARP